MDPNLARLGREEEEGSQGESVSAAQSLHGTRIAAVLTCPLMLLRLSFDESLAGGVMAGLVVSDGRRP